MPRPPKSRRRDSRAQVLAAARAEFAARGFPGAGVDRIAAKARVNKAMIYYHFTSKIGLYREVLRDGFRRLTDNARQAIAGAPTAIARFDAYIDSLVRTARADPHIVPIMLRELAGGGRHFDAETLRLMGGLFLLVQEILDEGRAAGEFREADALLTHFMVIGSTLLYVANEPIRDQVRRTGVLGRAARIPSDHAAMARHLGTVLRRTLCVAGEVSDDA
jgi:TetR/AcrR family transcriptional regulator